MSSTFKKTNHWNWIFTGAIIAPIFILMFSFLRDEASMRKFPILLCIAVIGGIAGRFVYGLNKNEKVKNGSSGRSGRIVRNLVIYLLMVLVGFVLVKFLTF